MVYERRIQSGKAVAVLAALARTNEPGTVTQVGNYFRVTVT